MDINLVKFEKKKSYEYFINNHIIVFFNPRQTLQAQSINNSSTTQKIYLFLLLCRKQKLLP